MATTSDVIPMPNKKPWVTEDIKAILSDKKRPFRAVNSEEDHYEKNKTDVQRG